MKKIIVVLAMALVCTMFFAACGPTAGQNEQTPSSEQQPTQPGQSGTTNPTPVQPSTTPTDASATEADVASVRSKLDFDDMLQGFDAQLQPQAEGDVVISQSGTYLFCGSYGKVTIAQGELDLQFVLNNASFPCADGIAIDGADVKKTNLTITLAEGSTNTVSGKDNAIQIKGSLDINGKGELCVTSSGKNAVKVSKALRIAESTLRLEAANHAVAALSIAARDCTIDVKSAGKEGLNAECDDETTQFTAEEGFVALKNVNYTCVTAGDGIQADTVVSIDGGSCNITTTGEFVADTSANRQQYDLESDDFRYRQVAGGYQKVASDYFGSNLFALKQSCKGIKVGEIEYPDPDDADEEVTVEEGNYCIAVASGSIVVNSTDDAVHANCGDVLVNGGDGIDSNGSVEICGGVVTVFGPVSNADGGLDSETGVYVNGGTLFVSASRGMTELPVADSEQNVIALGVSVIVAAGTVIRICQGGDVLFETTVAKNCQTIIFSSADITQGESYSVFAGETKLVDITATSRVTSSGVQGGFGGNPDGWRPGSRPGNPPIPR